MRKISGKLTAKEISILDALGAKTDLVSIQDAFRGHSFTCDRHRRYKGRSAPTSGCIVCWAMFLFDGDHVLDDIIQLHKMAGKLGVSV